MTRSVLGLDVGGANLKAAHSAGLALLHPFALWRDPEQLPVALARLLAQFPAFAELAVTMTGELCDCFASKRRGVLTILDAVERAAGPIPVWVWRNDGWFTDLATARAEPLGVAAANWLALAHFAGRYAPSGLALVIDVGSTTTDIIPLLDGQPIPRGRTDPERLRSRELVYTGVRRTPVCALLGEEGAAELFATTLDVYLALGQVAEDPSDRGTADGRPATREDARVRLARMRCGDLETCSTEEIGRLARLVRTRQVRLLQKAVRTVWQHSLGVDSFPVCVLAGSGEFLARLVLKGLRFWPTTRVVSLAAELGPSVSQAACAHAVAHLAAEGR
jgi:probable H4MPT-linked C1 transfer pathway protein